MKMSEKKKKTKVTVDITRRDVLSLAGVAAGSAAAAVLLTSGPLSPFASLKQEQLSVEEESGGHGAVGLHHWGMVIDLNACIGCEYCTRSCTAVNDVNTDKTWNIVVEEKTSGGQPSISGPACTARTHRV
jgi:ferredoxin